MRDRLLDSGVLQCRDCEQPSLMIPSMLPWLLFLPIGSTLEPPTSPSVPGTLAAQWRAEHPNHGEPGGYPIFALADVVMRWPTGEVLRYPFLAIAASAVTIGAAEPARRRDA